VSGSFNRKRNNVSLLLLYHWFLCYPQKAVSIFFRSECSPNDSESSPNDSESSPNDSESSPNDSESSPNDSESSPNDSECSPNDWECSPNEWECSPNDWECSPNEWECSPNDWECSPNDSESSPDGFCCFSKRCRCITFITTQHAKYDLSRHMFLLFYHYRHKYCIDHLQKD